MTPHACLCDPRTHQRLVIVVADMQDGKGQRRDEWIAFCDVCEEGRIALETRYVPREEQYDGGKKRRGPPPKREPVTRMLLVSAMREWPRWKPSVLEVHMDRDPVKVGREWEIGPGIPA